MMTRTLFCCALRAFLSGTTAAFLALRTLRFLPEEWLRERWEPPVERIRPSVRVCVCAACGCGALFASVAVVSRFDNATGNVPFRFLFFVLFAVVIQIAAVDIARLVIPDQHILAAFFLGFVFLLVPPGPATDLHSPVTAQNGLWAVFSSFIDTFPVAAGSALLAAVLTFLPVLPAFFGRRAALGLGDVKLFAALAFVLGAIRPDEGPSLALSFLAWAFVLNGLFALVALLLRKTKPAGALPMAPAVCLAFLFSLPF